ncbi:MAG: lipid A hydroxylase LpxO [Proteobacteria bacterium]|nr:lipid A hydroxylase LpxO [Pseudomonadota bacterium]
MKWFLLALFLVPAIYVHFRGRIRYNPFRQLGDHSTIFAPLNLFMYAFSRVHANPYLPSSELAGMDKLRAHWQEIRDEALALRAAHEIKASNQYNDVGFNSFFRFGWKRFYLKWYDDAHPSAVKLCPLTTQLLKELPQVKAAMFAELPSGARLMRHRDPYAGSLRYHLGLVTPNDDGCWIEVDGQRYSWRDGEDVVFDETYIHHAKNETQTDRIILFCDVERPMKYRWAQTVNDWFGRHLVRAAASPNEAGDATGGLNRVFKYFYAVRLKGKALKESNKRLYYAIKWSIGLVVLALIIWI